VYIRDYIEKKGLHDKVKIVLTVHDEILCEVKDEIAIKWLKVQTKLMNKAANKIIPGDWLGVEGSVFKRWEK
jgi:DNA polymerase I-like protein with 3'-5' exonuclease and polymerase domains